MQSGLSTTFIKLDAYHPETSAKRCRIVAYSVITSVSSKAAGAGGAMMQLCVLAQNSHFIAEYLYKP